MLMLFNTHKHYEVTKPTAHGQMFESTQFLGPHAIYGIAGGKRKPYYRVIFFVIYVKLFNFVITF